MSYPIFDFFKTKSQICFKFCVDVSWVDPYQICLRSNIPIFNEIIGNFVHFVKFLNLFL